MKFLINRMRIRIANGIVAIYFVRDIGEESYEHHIVKSYEIRFAWNYSK